LFSIACLTLSSDYPMLYICTYVYEYMPDSHWGVSNHHCCLVIRRLSRRGKGQSFDSVPYIHSNCFVFRGMCSGFWYLLTQKVAVSVAAASAICWNCWLYNRKVFYQHSFNLKPNSPTPKSSEHPSPKTNTIVLLAGSSCLRSSWWSFAAMNRVHGHKVRRWVTNMIIIFSVNRANVLLTTMVNANMTNERKMGAN